jgi:hypothetical protein
MHNPGSVYIIDNTENLLSVFQMNGHDYAVLISLDGCGNRWVDPVQVKDFNRITDQEMNMIAGDSKYSLCTHRVIVNEP